MLTNVYMKLFSEVIQRLGPSCHEHAVNTQLYPMLPACPRKVETMNQCVEELLKWTQINKMKLNLIKMEVL